MSDAATGMIAVTLNGETRKLPAGSTVSDLLTTLDAVPAAFAVEVNRGVVPKSIHAGQALADGDAVEIVTFVGGG